MWIKELTSTFILTVAYVTLMSVDNVQRVENLKQVELEEVVGGFYVMSSAIWGSVIHFLFIYSFIYFTKVICGLSDVHLNH